MYIWEELNGNHCEETFDLDWILNSNIWRDSNISWAYTLAMHEVGHGLNQSFCSSVSSKIRRYIWLHTFYVNVNLGVKCSNVKYLNSSVADNVDALAIMKIYNYNY